MKVKPKPFVKWAGGKARLAETIISHFPKNFNDYHEPFVGAGGLFFAIVNKGLLDNKKVTLSDLNHELIKTYLTITENPNRLIALLMDHKRNHCKEYFYRQREIDIFFSGAEVAARFIYLNRACFNGLYRVNKKGKFNTPFADGNDIIINQDNIYSVFRILNSFEPNLEISCKSFLECRPKKGDLVYCDPPYDKSYSSFTKDGFTQKDHIELKYKCDEWRKMGVYVVISNSNTEFVRDLWEDYKIEKIESRTVISAKNSGRRKVKELLIIGEPQ